MKDVSPFCDVVERFRKLGHPLNKYVNVTTNSYRSNNATRFNANNVLDSSSAIYHQEDVLSWLKIDFPKYSVNVESVRIRISNNQDPKYWVLEGSTDGNNFNVIYENKGDLICDRWQSRNCYCDYDPYKTLDVTPGVYNSLRMRMTNAATCGEKLLIIKTISIFGNIIMPCFHSKCPIKATNISPFVAVFLLVTKQHLMICALLLKMIELYFFLDKV